MGHPSKTMYFLDYLIYKIIITFRFQAYFWEFLIKIKNFMCYRLQGGKKQHSCIKFHK